MTTRSEYRAIIDADRARLAAHIELESGRRPMLLWTHPGWLCVRLHRTAHRFWVQGKRKRARIVYQLAYAITGGDVHPNASLGPGLRIASPAAINVSGVAGRNLTFSHRGGMGILPSDQDIGAGPGLPVLEDDVLIGSSCGPLGAVRLRSGSMIGVRCFRYRDVGAGMAVMRSTRCRIVPASQAGGGKDASHQPAVAARADRASPCRHDSLRVTLRALRSDLERHHAERTGSDHKPGVGGRLSALLTNSGMLLATYRLSHWLHLKGLGAPASAVCGMGRWGLKGTISPGACIGDGFFLPHPGNVLLHGTYGKQLTLFACALSTPHGLLEAAGDGQLPRTGDGAVIGGLGMLVGGVTLGDRVRVASMVTLDCDAEDDRTALSEALRLIERERVVPSPEQLKQAARDQEAQERAADPGPGWRATRREDRRRLKELTGRSGIIGWLALRLSPGSVAVGLFRGAVWLRRRGYWRGAQVVRQINMLLTGADLDPRSSVGPGLVVPYPASVSLHAHAGRNLTMLGLSGIDADAERPGLAARLGDDVFLGHQAVITGPVTIGDRVRIEAGAFIDCDVATDHRVLTPAVRTRRLSGGEAP